MMHAFMAVYKEVFSPEERYAIIEEYGENHTILSSHTTSCMFNTYGQLGINST